MTTISSLATTLPTPAHSVNGSALPYSEMAHEINMSEDTPQKRKRALEDTGDREQKKVHIEDRKLGIEDLHMDVGEKYLLCKTRKAPFIISKVSCTSSTLPAVRHGLVSLCRMSAFVGS
jgi:DNA-binding Lrp family transcriptional regulator